MGVEHTDAMTASHTLADVLRWRAEHQPDGRAFTVLPDGETEEFPITYAALHRRASAMAAMLRREAAEPERALILCPPGLDYLAAFFGCLYASVTAVPACPPDPADPQRTLPRLRAIAMDSDPAVIVATTSVLPFATEIMADEAPSATRRWLMTDEVADAEAAAAGAAERHEPAVSGESLALLQYTSGSTGAPKGVMISHRNLMDNEARIQSLLSATEDSVCVSWLPLHHSMGLIGTALQAVYTGFPCVLMSPGDFLRKPVRWLQAITRYRATLSGGPNFAYDLCISKVTPAQRAALDLGTWSVAVNAAEPIQPGTVEGFTTAFEACGFRGDAFLSGYGLAEATWMISSGPVTSLPAAGLAGSGRIPADHTLLIVDPDKRRPCPDGEANEIWVRGPSVAAGYWNMPRATDETFGAHLAGTGDGPFLRTGDMGLIRGGELFVTSRRQSSEDGSSSRDPHAGEGEDGLAGEIVMALLDMDSEQRAGVLSMYLQQQVARVLALPPSDISESQQFMALGLNSLGVLGLRQSIEADLGVVVPLGQFIDCPTIGQLAPWISDDLEQSVGALLAEVGQLTDEEVGQRLKHFTVKEQ